MEQLVSNSAEVVASVQQVPGEIGLRIVAFGIMMLLALGRSNTR